MSKKVHDVLQKDEDWYIETRNATQDEMKRGLSVGSFWKKSQAQSVIVRLRISLADKALELPN